MTTAPTNGVSNSTTAFNDFWKISSTAYQNNFKIVDEPEQPSISFPLVLVPSSLSPSIETVIKGIRELGAKSSDPSGQSHLRKLLDANGGAVNFKNLPLRSAQDFSAILKALAGSGDHAWFPHKDFGMQVLRKEHAENVVSTNEGPPTYIIRWHNEYAVSPSHPAYVVFFCLTPPVSGGETPITSSLAVFDRLRRQEPQFVNETVVKGVTYLVNHTDTEVDGTVGGNGVYKSTAFGPKDGADISKMTVEAKHAGVETRIRELAELGGWRSDYEEDDALPLWQRKGFTWKWKEDGSVDVTSRVAGVRIHPTRRLGSFFNAMGTRYENAKVRGTFEPPHMYIDEKGVERLSLPPLFSGLEADQPISKYWLERMDALQKEFASEIKWEVGDVLIIDNFACQHARWPWTGERKILASFWDEPGLKAEAMTPRSWNIRA